MTENWKQQLQQKMDSFEKPAHELSWSEIDKALKARATNPQTRKTTILPLWTKRIASAAAVVLIAIAGTRLLFISEEANNVDSNTQNNYTSQQADKKPINPLKQRIESIRELAVAEKAKTVARLETTTPSADTAEEVAVELPTAEETGTSEEDKMEKKVQEKATRKTGAANQDYRYMALTEQPSYTKKRGLHSGLAADLHVQGLMGVNNSGNGVGTMNLLMSDAPTYSNGEMQMQGIAYPLMTTKRRDLSYDHDLPIKIGVSLRYNIDERWSIVTGVNYSYLHSTFTVNDNPDHNGSQKLHYIGIPVAASLNIWQNDQLKLYITAGGTAEKLLKGNMKETTPGDVTEETKLTESRLQWSMQGAAGVEYNITPALGLYVEPGISHHFNNHSDIQNIYKEKPWNFSLNLGFRLNIK